MSTNMMIRSLDASGDWIWGQGAASFLTGEAAVELNVATNLQCFRNDCFYNMGYGVDWFNLLGGTGAASTENGILLQCREMIINSENIVAINTIDAVLLGPQRKLTVSYNLSSIYSISATGQVQPVPFTS